MIMALSPMVYAEQAELAYSPSLDRGNLGPLCSFSKILWTGESGFCAMPERRRGGFAENRLIHCVEAAELGKPVFESKLGDTCLIGVSVTQRDAHQLQAAQQ
jgi:hypothetical protein